MTPHPDVVAKRKAIDMSDLEADSIVMWQKRQVAYIHIHSHCSLSCEIKYMKIQGTIYICTYIRRRRLIVIFISFRKFSLHYFLLSHNTINFTLFHLSRRLYIPLFALLTIGLPVAVPCYFWSESLWISFWVNFNFRFCINLNIAFCVNSVAHMWGQKPYDKYVSNHDESNRKKKKIVVTHFLAQ